MDIWMEDVVRKTVIYVMN